MIRLAICDDAAKDLKKTESVVKKLNPLLSAEYRFHIESYLNPQVLIDDLTEGKTFDVFLLDMKLGEITGIELANEIRKTAPSATIIFLSANTDFPFLRDGYKVRALRYVSKLAMEPNLNEALHAAILDQCKEETKYLSISHYNDSVRIAHGDIIYVRRSGRSTEVVLLNAEPIRIRSPLKEVHKKLDSERFLYVDRSCFVNVDFILKLSGGTVTLKSGDTLSVSRKALPVLRAAITRLWGGIT